MRGNENCVFIPADLPQSKTENKNTESHVDRLPVVMFTTYKLAIDCMKHVSFQLSTM